MKGISFLNYSDDSFAPSSSRLTLDCCSAIIRLNLVYKEAEKMESALTYLDTYVLQQDMRIRLPKSILANLNVEKGTTKFDIYLDVKSKELIFRVHREEE